MTKTPEEKLFDAINKAVSENDTDAVDALLAPIEDLGNADPIKEEAPEPENKTDEAKIEDEPATTRSDYNGSEVEGTETDEAAELRRQLEESKQAQHRLKSDAGRVPGLQRKLAELDKRLKEMAERSADPNDVDASYEDALNNEHLSIVRETDPILAKAIEASIKQALTVARKHSTETAREVTTAFVEDHDHEALRQQWDILVEQVPDAADIFKSGAWERWKDKQDPETRAKAESPLANEVLEAINLFNGPAQGTQATASSQLAEGRADRLRRVTPNTASTPSRVKAPSSEEELFKQMYAEALKAEGRYNK
jgi:hypothetical protein